jgi:recombination protein RecA
MSKGLRKLTAIAAKTGTMIIFINQIRMKIGVMFGNPETTTGGNALKFFATQRIEIRRGEKVEESKEQVGYKAKVKVVKNKIAPPFRACEVLIRFNQGIDKIDDLVNIALEKGLITRAGAFYTLYDQKFQGKAALVNELKEKEALRKQLEEDVRNIILSQNKAPAEKASDDEILEDVE